MNPAPFTQLHAFLVVARHRSFSAAARELGVSRSAVSQSVRQLETQLRVTLLVRTTRSVSLTDVGKRLAEQAGPGLQQMLGALGEVGAKPGEVVGRVRITVPSAAVPFVIEPVVPVFHARNPRVQLEVTVESRLVDIVAEGYDAGVRLTESIERDMIQVRLTDPFRFVIVGSPAYLAKHGVPEKPEDLLRHECITFRSQTTGALYAWELERGRRTWRVPVRGGVVTSNSDLNLTMAERGVGLSYAFEPLAMKSLEKGKLQRVLEAYSPTVPGFFLFYPSSARHSAPLRAFVEVAKQKAVRAL